MLLSLRESLDPDSLRVAEIDAGLRDFTTIADFELPAEEMRADLPRRRGEGSPRCSRCATARPRRRSSPSGTATLTSPGSGRWRKPSARPRARSPTNSPSSGNIPATNSCRASRTSTGWSSGIIPELYERVEGGGEGRPDRRRRRDVGGAGHEHHRRRVADPPVPPRQAVLPRGVRRGLPAALAAGRVRLLRPPCRKF